MITALQENTAPLDAQKTLALSMSTEHLALLVAFLSLGISIWALFHTRRAARSSEEQLKLTQAQAEAQPNIEVSWADPKIKYDSYNLGQAVLYFQIKNIGKEAVSRA